MPHPAPDAAGNEDDDVKMGFLSVLKVELSQNMSGPLLTSYRLWLSQRLYPSSSISSYPMLWYQYGSGIEAGTANICH
jgi:hypothetical protein